MKRESTREILSFFTLGAAAFLLVCLYTQDIRDTLDGTGTVRNVCGPLGAAVSYHLVLWVGKPAAYALSSFVGLAGLLLFFRRRLEDWPWKILGAILLALAISSWEVAYFHDGGSPRTLPGGFFGQFFYETLFSNLSRFGTYLILGLAALVAFLISTDTALYPVLSRAGRTVGNRERWRAAALRVKRRVATLRFPSLPRLQTALPMSPAGTTRGPALRRGGPEGRETGSCGDAASGREPVGAGTREDPDEAGVAGGPGEAAAAGPSPASESGGAGTFTIRLPEPEPRPSAAGERKAARRTAAYQLPPLTLLEPSPPAVDPLDRTLLERTASKIEHTLRDFKIEARVVEVQKGPTITQFEVTLAAGIKVHRIVNLADDLAMALKAQSIRIVAPIPGKSTVGIEVPNRNRSTVGLRELLEYTMEQSENYKLPLCLGRDTAGAPVIGDLGEMPHLLIAGSTGSGKSVAINSIITNLLLSRTPEEVKLILVDPKMVELAQFENMPHLLSPVVTDMKKAPAVLNWLVDKMEERYELLAMAGVRHIASYNALGRTKLHDRLAGKMSDEEIEEIPAYLPSVVVIIDELADLMMTASKEVEGSITRLSQKSRAVGIHVILATQRPSVDVITGLIKANMPSRISFRVASKVDSRTILDRNGAEKLLGKGDMLFLPPGTSDVVRVQGTYISDKEIREIVAYTQQEAEPQFNAELTRFGIEGAGDGGEEDELYDRAVEIVLSSQRGSVTLLQRQLQIGYTRASRLMEIMCERGLVGPFKGSKAREVYYTLEDWERMKRRRGGQEPAAADPE